MKNRRRTGGLVMGGVCAGVLFFFLFTARPLSFLMQSLQEDCSYMAIYSMKSWISRILTKMR